MKKITFLSAILLTANALLAQIIRIPADYPAIQQGINAANPGDTVLVSPGTYAEILTFSGKQITVASLFLTTRDTAYISQTRIDGNRTGDAVAFTSGEDSTALLCGFTLTNGNSGIFCYNSGPVLCHLTIEGNVTPLGGWAETSGGGGIYCILNSTPRQSNVTIAYNTASKNGGGLFCSGYVDMNQMSQVNIINTEISHNSAPMGGGIYCDFSKLTGVDLAITDNTATWGGGLYCDISKPVFNNITLAKNKADSAGGGIYSRSYSRYNMSKITNSIVWNNLPQEIFLEQSSTVNAVIISYSNLKGGESSVVTSGQDTVIWLEGNINVDPLFTGSGAYPYSLLAGSPCRNAVAPDTSGLFLPLTDLAGGPRIWEERVDMGAYEWNNVGIPDIRITNYM
jgi:predicted outer membrane repeat protein